MEEERHVGHRAAGFLARGTRKLSLAAKLVAACVVVAAVVVLVVAFRQATSGHETQTFAESDLVDVVNVESLSTFDYTYHGIAEQAGKILFIDKTDYRVKYDMHVSAVYQLSSIRFKIDASAKSVTAYLPAAQLEMSAPANMSYMNVSANPDVDDVIRLCREDAQNDIDLDMVRKRADENLKNTVTALTKPLLDGDGWELEFAELAQFSGEGADDEGK